MKRTILCLAAALALSGCGLSLGDTASAGATVADAAGAPAPVAAADKTRLDEAVITGAELAYKAARLSVETLTDAGQIKGATARRVAELDNQAFLALAVARGAYRAGNSASNQAAEAEARRAVSDLLTLVSKPGA
jgi:hypothetical protein